MAARLARLDPRVGAQGEIVPSSGKPFDNFPAFVAKASGAYIWDVDGNRYVDYLLGYGPVILGHNHDVVQAAVRRSLDEAVCQTPMWAQAQVDLVELLCDVIPNAEMAFVLKTGSDATSCAVRLARTFTGRDHVVRVGYNGWHDWANPKPAGIPKAVRRETTEVYGRDVEGLVDAVDRHRRSLAAVVMMPYEFEEPDLGYLEAARRSAKVNGALFVLDEVRSGFRLALGGVQEYLGITADLVCLSKAMANGYPISAVAGRSDVMQCLSRTKVSSTFFANRLEQYAAIATIQELRATRPFAHISAMGGRLMRGVNEVAANLGIDARVSGHPSSPFLRFASSVNASAVNAFYEQVAKDGVLLHPSHQWFVSAAHTAADVDETVAVISAALDRIQRSQ